MIDLKQFNSNYSSSEVQIGNIALGSNHPVVIQSMTNTDTADVKATVQQIKRLVAVGCEMVRATVPSMKEVESMKEIKCLIRAEGIDIPLIADVHFNPDVAVACASVVDKVRVNPGNFVDKRNFKTLNLTDTEYNDSLERMALRAQPLLQICKDNGTALRIGTNHGSLCDRIVSRYGNTPLAMAMSAMEWVHICQHYDFQNVVLSMKSSNAQTMVESTVLLAEMMQREGTVFPLHLGVTEAGAGNEGRVKSAVGIGALLLAGLGNTIRVSLTEPPENEVPFAQLLANVVFENEKVTAINENQVLHITYHQKDFQQMMAVTGARVGFEHFQHSIKDLIVENQYFTKEQNCQLADMILQACRVKMSQTEFISCPSCGRTQYDIQTVLEKVKARFSGYPNLKIGVMGCIVNGPGEMADADFGIVGATHGKVAVYRNKERVTPPLSVEDALLELERLVNQK